jgi:TetR/AcrR family transcriptional regulator, cholesterol catabolism regulator
MEQNSNLELEISETPVSPQKQAILDVAENLFAEHGYEGLSIRDLAEHCGLAKATIYHHFQDKEEIFMSVLAQEMLKIHARTMGAGYAVQDPVERLRVVIHAYCQMMSERRSLILSAIHASADVQTHARDFIHRHRQLFLEPLTAIIQQGIEEGRFRAVNAQLSAASLLGMLNSTVSFRLLFENMEYNEDAADHIFDLFFHGIGIAP